MAKHEPITLLHISDTQFGRNHRYGNLGKDDNFNTLFTRLTDDLKILENDFNLCPQAVVLTGDLTESAKAQEFQDALDFANSLVKYLDIPFNHFAIVPGNHDINREAYKANPGEIVPSGTEPTEPFWPKWENFAKFFRCFYKGYNKHLTFTKEKPWTLFEMPKLKLVIAGLNSTMKESNLKESHYGYIGEKQLRSFAKHLAYYQEQGLFRIATLHHNIRRGPVDDDANLRDVDAFIKILGDNVNLVLHGHTHEGKSDLCGGGIPILATGSVAVNSKHYQEEVPNQYQIIQIWPGNYDRCCRAYFPSQHRWIGDTRADEKGNSWTIKSPAHFHNIDGTFPAKEFNERNNNPFSDIEPFLEGGDIVTAFNLILKGKHFKECADHDQYRYLLIKQKWGFFEKTDIDNIIIKLKALAKCNKKQTLLIKIKILYHCCPR